MSEQTKKMLEDAEFMRWLGQYDPDWPLAYSGDLIALWDAFRAGSVSSDVDPGNSDESDAVGRPLQK